MSGPEGSSWKPTGEPHLKAGESTWQPTGVPHPVGESTWQQDPATIKKPEVFGEDYSTWDARRNSPDQVAARTLNIKPGEPTTREQDKTRANYEAVAADPMMEVALELKGGRQDLLKQGNEMAAQVAYDDSKEAAYQAGKDAEKAGKSYDALQQIEAARETIQNSSEDIAA